jgi:hypothetical protein
MHLYTHHVHLVITTSYCTTTTTGLLPELFPIDMSDSVASTLRAEEQKTTCKSIYKSIYRKNCYQEEETRQIKKHTQREAQSGRLKGRLTRKHRRKKR